MIILHIFDQLCNTNICHNKAVVDHVYFVQNTISFVVLCITCMYIFRYVAYNDIDGFMPCTNLLLGYLAYDLLFIEKPSLYIHHGIVFAMFSLFQQIPRLHVQNLHPVFATLFFTEISSVFLSLIFMQKYIHKYIVHQEWMTHLYTLWKICFLVTFVGFRLIYYPASTLFNPSFARLLMDYTDQISDVVQTYLLFSALFLLNIYWFVLILNGMCYTDRKEK